MAKIRICMQEGCHNASTTRKFCRLHYLKNWRQIKETEQEKAAKKLNNYVERMMKKNPGEYMNDIKKDLKNEKSFERGFEEPTQGGELDEVMKVLGYKEEETLDELVKHIKIDESY
ncbi:MAG: hypothetical protein Q7S00_04155 [bacterium]|nr:hypothetical protein [bacterium]